VDRDLVKKEVATRYLEGEGIEIGALHLPLDIPEGVKVRYLDRMSVAELRQQYPELAGWNLVEADIIDDGETLESIPDNSLDFVIAKHMIEHCQNPIGAIKNFLRVVKDGGIVYLAVPDKRYIFDCDRPVTSLDHLIRDYTEGPEWSKMSHYEEWVRLVEKVPEEQVITRAQELYGLNKDLHFHVWTPTQFSELIFYCQAELCLDFQLELFQDIETEVIVILRKKVQESAAQYLRLDLGCGANKKLGTIGLDSVFQSGVDYVIDVQQGNLPFPDRSVEYVYSSHYLQRLESSTLIRLFQDISRVCVSGAQLEFWTPYAWDNSAFIFGNTSYYSEDNYMHLCVWFADLWEQSFGAKWLLKELIYIVKPSVLIELYKHKTSLEFALRHYKGVAVELGVVIEICRDSPQATLYPKRTFATARNARKYQLQPEPVMTDESELRQAIDWFSQPS